MSTIVLYAQANHYEQYYKNLPTTVKAVERITIPANEVYLTEVGGVGDGVTLCTEALEKGISKLSKMGGGRLIIPQGVWLTGPIALKDNIELHLEKNALVVFSPDKSLYVDKKSPAGRVFPCIRASKRTNIAITGKGTVDGNGQTAICKVSQQAIFPVIPNVPEVLILHAPSPQYLIHRPPPGQLVHQLIQLANLLHPRVGDGLHLDAAHLSGNQRGAGVPRGRAVDKRAVVRFPGLHHRELPGGIARQPGRDGIDLVPRPALAHGLLDEAGIDL